MKTTDLGLLIFVIDSCLNILSFTDSCYGKKIESFFFFSQPLSVMHLFLLLKKLIATIKFLHILNHSILLGESKNKGR